ncbi:MAG: hypothetical protein PHT33_08350 [bacterium]|nr:hypothetical protein [bacterium]
MKTYNMPKDRVTYNYRYFLPYFPEWGSEEFCRQRLQELLRFCREAGVDEVQFYVNTLPGTYYMPAHSAQEQMHWAGWMKEEVAPAVRAAGVSFQLNYQMLLGTNSSKYDMRRDYDWEFLVDQHGRETLGCACPIGPVFRETMGEMLRLWAGTEPDILWIDDDFRLHNHGLGDRGPDFYCYCPLHLKRFGEYAGRHYTREDLLEETLKPGEPTQLRREWLSFLGKTMTETAAWIEEQVHGISPDTRLALMTSRIDNHAAEGREWKPLLEAMCGEHKPIVRPAGGLYAGTAVPVKKHAETFRLYEQAVSLLRETFGRDGVDFGPELENSRFTTWNKSTVNTRYVMVLGQLLGCNHITLSLNDLEGSPIDEEPTVVPLLSRSRPMLQALAGMELVNWRPEGVGFLCDPASACKVRLKRNGIMGSLAPVRELEEVLLQSGVPACYLSPAEAAKRQGIVVLDGFTAWLPSEREMEDILSGAVFMNGPAAAVLNERGFGKHIGLSVGRKTGYMAMSEVYLGGVLPEVHGCRVPCRSMNWRELRLEGACELSGFVDPGNGRHTASCLYENPLGGRAAVYAAQGDTIPYATFGNHARMRWLRALLGWLSRDGFPVLPLTAQDGMTIIRSSDEGLLAAFASLGTDPLEAVTLRLYRTEPLRSIDVLQATGQWRQADFSIAPPSAPGAMDVSVACKLHAFDWLIALIR